MHDDLCIVDMPDGMCSLLTDALARSIVAHARAEAPREACGLVVRLFDIVHYLPAENHAQGNGEFVMPPEAWALAEDQGTVLALVHSHPDGSAEPSPHDWAACKASGVPWWIVGLGGSVADWAEITPWESR